MRAATTGAPAGSVSTTYSSLEEIQLPGVGTFALITLTGRDRKPATFSPESLNELGTLLQRVADRAAAGEFVGVGITGQGRIFVAGADLTAMRDLTDAGAAREIAALGHEVFGVLAEMTVPTFAFINGAAIGGGLEIALAADHRTVSSAANGIALPEAYLGLVPGWGGVYRLPRLIGPRNAVKVMIENALSNNRTLSGTAAHDLGIADTVCGSTDFLAESLAWAGSIIANDRQILTAVAARRTEKDHAADVDWDTALGAGHAFLAARNTGTPAPLRVLELLERGRTLSQAESAELEIHALTELILTPQFKNSVYALLDLLQRRSKHPSGAPDPDLARPVRKVGVVGAGLMASQLALLFAQQRKMPVVMSDIDQARVDKGIAYVHAEVDKLVSRKQISADEATRTKALVTGSVTKDVFADADFVIEAVFEELAVKKQVFAEVEAIVSDDCILATNTSSLSVSDMAAELQHPERVIGFHFFNPVASMPLVEIVAASTTSNTVLATALALGRSLKKTAVLTQDATAFVANRLLLRLMGEVVRAFDEGTPAETADNALKPMGLPMTPFTLLAMIGIPVAQHVTESLNAAFGDRFPVSANQQKLIDRGIKGIWATDEDGLPYVPQSTLDVLEFGTSPITSGELLERVQLALAEEIRLLLSEGVVDAPEDVDLCMITGAGWPLHLGGITPYLDRTGASERVNGRLFHPKEDGENQ
ncbi:3-hydroxyacyl-CoA dehydrogenase NAD-binding domain-containing protein [Arthrobacter globiformis]|uniref:3-hydroxyacyl-CoA dehydrogenase NAD-binding domain-containing protein n=1 Tax=Arthrobacter globiformis TaxID=1665 RepID=UPI00278C9DF0|nr:3-hydroxyacyl-CoA dehydrogenase NAD-binding domain-containing protein [Arthrobacter globiformis]MDQ0618371.1 3-hydroxyacyl-CoA dehydrogenase/enoyl-CoA hydratase/carnithine racemase [Arthrobacter globiformis]